jgi:ABC-type antimicrobial peptide transport system permease subunit
VVVGVVDTIRLSSLEEDTSDGMRYYPFAQSDSPAVHFVVRTDGDPRSIAAVLKQAVESADSGQALSDIASFETLVSDSLAGRRLIVWMLTAFAGLALTLAVVGLYGLISFVTAQRTSEVGIRMALGAQRKDVVGLILRSALVRVIIGLSIGVVISIFMSAVLSRWFADFGRGEPVALVVAAGALVYTGLIAGAIPARRASKVDPMVALRYE